MKNEASQLSAYQEDKQRLIDWFGRALGDRSRPRMIIAFSGGVDSALVCAAAQASWEASQTGHCGYRDGAVLDIQHDRLKAPIAVTAKSPSVASWQIDQAITNAEQIGIIHHFVEPSEINDEAYRRNDSSRCFHCKTHLYSSIADAFVGIEEIVVCSGTNADDLGDHRPGIAAGDQLGIRKPLAELGIGKTRVRELAKSFGLSCHDLPASPCLASRVVYGLSVSVSRLALIETLEGQLRRAGFDPVRVRLRHQADGVSQTTLEVSQGDQGRLETWITQNDIEKKWWQEHRTRMEIDRRGFESGRLNAPEEQLNVIP
ncbi:MAG: ATP-dependent sacrificial sulfur transferase LarE [Planctomycetota bacterium]